MRAMERTLIIVKPDGVKRNLAEEIIRRYERTGLRVVARTTVKATPALLRKHYAAHTGKDFYSALEEYVLESPVVAFVLEGESAVAVARKATGATDPSTAEKGTIRGDLGIDSRELADSEKRSIRNLVHASGTKEEAAQEIRLWFPELTQEQQRKIRQNDRGRFRKDHIKRIHVLLLSVARNLSTYKTPIEAEKKYIRSLLDMIYWTLSLKSIE